MKRRGRGRFGLFGRRVVPNRKSSYADVMTTAVNDALERLLDPVGRCLSVRGAQQLVRLRADAKTQKRIERLADKNTEGLLTSAERAEYETYVFANNFIAILQAKASARLARRRRQGA